MDQALLTPLNQLETSLNALLDSLTTTNTFANAPNATQALVSADDSLTLALTQLKEHQSNYARILALRAESERLQAELRQIVRTCVDLRSEIANIHPSILDDTDTDDEEDEEEQSETRPEKRSQTTNQNGANDNIHQKQKNPVSYTTLLNFAARIGKHNATAAIEAERQSNQRSTPLTLSQQPQSQTQTQTQTQTISQSELNGDNNGNGNITQQTQTTDLQTTQTTTQTNNTTQESLAELAAINDTLAAQRAARGMAFPVGEALRLGSLGRLQYIREQQGEGEVDKEVERLVRESEGHRITAKDEQEDEKEGTGRKEEDVGESLPSRPLQSGDVPQQPPPSQQQQQVQRSQSIVASQAQSQPQPQQSLPPKPKIALDLDFPGSDDDDDDD